MILGHIAPYLEALMFLPAFLVVLWSVVMTVRRRNEAAHVKGDL